MQAYKQREPKQTTGFLQATVGSTKQLTPQAEVCPSLSQQ